jgi:hypothetical protein
MTINIVAVPPGHFIQPDGSYQPSPALQIEHMPPPEPCEAPRSPEEENQVINNLKAEINELSRKMGIGLVV